MQLKFINTTPEQLYVSVPHGYATQYCQANYGVQDTKGREIGDRIAIVPNPAYKWEAILDANGKTQIKGDDGKPDPTRTWGTVYGQHLRHEGKFGVYFHTTRANVGFGAGFNESFVGLADTIEQAQALAEKHADKRAAAAQKKWARKEAV